MEIIELLNQKEITPIQKGKGWKKKEIKRKEDINICLEG
jgi:hypothetical protein